VALQSQDQDREVRQLLQDLIKLSACMSFAHGVDLRFEKQHHSYSDLVVLCFEPTINNLLKNMRLNVVTIFEKVSIEWSDHVLGKQNSSKI